MTHRLVSVNCALKGLKRLLRPGLGAVIALSVLGSTSFAQDSTEPQTQAEQQVDTSATENDSISSGLKLLINDGPPIVPNNIGLTPDLAYGAFQRGWFLTSMAMATPLAENGDPAAQTLLGVLHETGRGIARDYIKAAEWYQLAAAQGSAEAALRLGQFYLLGNGVPADTKKAADYFEIAAEAEKPSALYNLALLFQSGDGRARDTKKARDLLMKAARLNDPEAQYTLGLSYLEGIGGTIDEGQGAFWLGRAARRGHTSAQVYYGILRFQGRGLDPDETEAASWFERAAMTGNPVAMNRLARIYANGRGRPQDPVQAAGWHYVARALGVEDPMLDTFVNGLDPQTIEAAKTFAGERTTTLFAPSSDQVKPSP